MDRILHRSNKPRNDSPTNTGKPWFPMVSACRISSIHSISMVFNPKGINQETHRFLRPTPAADSSGEARTAQLRPDATTFNAAGGRREAFGALWCILLCWLVVDGSNNTFVTFGACCQGMSGLYSFFAKEWVFRIKPTKSHSNPWMSGRYNFCQGMGFPY